VSDDHQHTMNRNVIGWIAVGIQAVLLLALILAPSRRSWGSLWPPDLAGVVGVMCLGAAGGLLLVAFRALSSALTPNPVPLPGQTLRTTGIYRLVRHPIYSAVLLGSVGYTCAVGSWWQVLLTALLAVFFSAKARWEDALLAEQYGEQWRAYRDRTGGLIPHIKVK
jgi:protein-S-isoprenylcysteine O-methyltransferase Ste14